MEVYKITNNITGEFYIGKNEGSNPKYYGSGGKIKESINKFGIENHTKHVIATISSTSPNPKKDLRLIEGVYIREYYDEENCLNQIQGMSQKKNTEIVFCLDQQETSDGVFFNKEYELKTLKNEFKTLEEKYKKSNKRNNELIQSNNLLSKHISTIKDVTERKYEEQINTLVKNNKLLNDSIKSIKDGIAEGYRESSNNLLTRIYELEAKLRESSGYIKYWKDKSEGVIKSKAVNSRTLGRSLSSLLKETTTDSFISECDIDSRPKQETLSRQTLGRGLQELLNKHK